MPEDNSCAESAQKSNWLLQITTPPRNKRREERRRISRNEFWKKIYHLLERHDIRYEKKGPTLVILTGEKPELKSINEKVVSLHVQKFRPITDTAE